MTPPTRGGLYCLMKTDAKHTLLDMGMLCKHQNKTNPTHDLHGNNN